MEIFKTFKYQSLPKNNPYAPEWNLNINEFRLPDKFCNELKKVLKETIDIKSSWKTYNIFAINSPVIDDLKLHIKNVLPHYKNTEDLWINGWINYQTKEESVRLHNHAIHNNSYLSGTLCLTRRKDVFTKFHIPILSNNPEYGPLSFPSLKGRMVIFPSYIPHEVTPIPYGDRISIGFDLLPDQAITYFKRNSNNSEDPLFRAIPFNYN